MSCFCISSNSTTSTAKFLARTASTLFTQIFSSDSMVTNGSLFTTMLPDFSTWPIRSSGKPSELKHGNIQCELAKTPNISRSIIGKGKLLLPPTLFSFSSKKSKYIHSCFNSDKIRELFKRILLVDTWFTVFFCGKLKLLGL